MRNVMHFNGRNSAEWGVVITKEPTITTPEERGEAIDIPGKNGDIWRGDGSYLPISISVPLWVPPRSSIAQVRGWLVGNGKLSFGMDSLYWEARVSGETPFVPRDFYDGWDAVVTFVCQPFRRIETNAIDITSNPQTIFNPYSAYSEPLIKVKCTGEFALTVSGSTCILAGVTGDVMLDTQLQECYQGRILLNDKMTGVFPVLSPGNNELSYSGNVTSIQIEPRWRSL